MVAGTEEAPPGPRQASLAPLWLPAHTLDACPQASSSQDACGAALAAEQALQALTDSSSQRGQGRCHHPGFTQEAGECWDLPAAMCAPQVGCPGPWLSGVYTSAPVKPQCPRSLQALFLPLWRGLLQVWAWPGLPDHSRRCTCTPTLFSTLFHPSVATKLAAGCSQMCEESQALADCPREHGRVRWGSWPPSGLPALGHTARETLSICLAWPVRCKRGVFTLIWKNGKYQVT